MLLEMFEGEAVHDPVDVAGVIDVPQQVHRAVAGVDGKFFLHWTVQRNLHQVLVQGIQAGVFGQAAGQRVRPQHAAGVGIDQQPGGCGSGVYPAVRRGDLKVTGEEDLLADAIGPGANGERVEHGGKAVENHFHAGKHPQPSGGAHVVIIVAQVGGVIVGGVLERFKKSGGFPQVKNVGFVGMDSGVLCPDGNGRHKGPFRLLY